MGRQKKGLDSHDGQVRTVMLKSAAHLFSLKGYAATTVREIVAAAGVSKPVLYYYFGSKEGIYFELMRGPGERFDAVLRDFRQGGGTAGERLLALCDEVFTLFCENVDAIRIMYSVFYGPSQGAPFIDFEAHHAKLRNALRGLIEEGCESGEFRSIAVDDAVWAFLGALSAAIETGLLVPEAAIGHGGLSRILRILLAGISAPARPGAPV